jgi:hypothetical protein
VPGATKVNDGKYHIVDNKRQGALISKDSWNQSVFPGAELSMSIIISVLQRHGARCPRPRCSGKLDIADPDKALRWYAKTPYGRLYPSLTNIDSTVCALISYPTSPGIEDCLGCATVQDPDATVGQRQAEEDLQIFGSRPKPSDPEEVADVMPVETPKPRLKKTASEALTYQELRPKMVCQTDTTFTPQALQTVTAVDWNSGETPIDAWLNQSAVPFAGLLVFREQDQVPQTQHIAKREEEELAFYRRIHIAASSEPSIAHPGPMDLDWQDELEFGAQIYYRNIIDKFPIIPHYLACRLAKANLKRARRLRFQKAFMETYGARLAELEDYWASIEMKSVTRRRRTEQVEAMEPHEEPCPTLNTIEERVLVMKAKFGCPRVAVCVTSVPFVARSSLL